MSVEVLKALAHLDADSLNAAAKAARRAGVPLADFLSQAVATENPDMTDGTGLEASKPKARKPRRTARAAGASAADFSPITDALDGLSDRMDAAEHQSAQILNSITQALGVLAARIPSKKDYADIQQAASTAAIRSEAFQHLSSRVDDIMARIETVEASPEGDAGALQGLEDAIGRLAGHIEERHGETAHSIAALGGTVQRLTEQLSSLQESDAGAVEALREQMYGFSEQLAAVSERSGNLVERNELSDFEQRLEDRFGKALEERLDRTLNDFTMRLEGAEGRSADAIQAVENELAATSKRLLSLEEQIAAIAEAGTTETSTHAMAASGMLTDVDKRLREVENRGRAERKEEFEDLRREFRELSERIAGLENNMAAAPAAAPLRNDALGAAAYQAAPVDVEEEPAQDEADTLYQREAAEAYEEEPATPLTYGPEDYEVDEDTAEDEAAYQGAERGEIRFPHAEAAAPSPVYEDPDGHEEELELAEADPAPDFLAAAREAARAANEAREAAFGTQDKNAGGDIPRRSPFGGARSLTDTPFEEDDEEDPQEGVRRSFEGRNQAWRFAENYYNTQTRQATAQGGEPVRAKRKRRHGAAWMASNRSVIMAAAGAVAVAVMIGVFLALQATNSNDIEEPGAIDMAADDGDGSMTLSPVTGNQAARPSTQLDSDFDTSSIQAQPYEDDGPGNSLLEEAEDFSADDRSGLSALFDSGVEGYGAEEDVIDTGSVVQLPPSVDQQLAETNEVIEESYGPDPIGPQPVSAAPQRSAAPRAEDINARALYSNALASLRNSSGDTADAAAAANLQQAANAGLIVAHYRLGTLYQEGRGVTRDMLRARDHYEVAARGGNYSAMHNLAVIYAAGQGVPQDLTKASAWFKRAAELGVTDSQFNLAVLYLQGQGIAQNTLEAYRWFTIAAAQGDTEAVKHRDQMREQLGAKGASVAVEAARWSPEPAEPVANGFFFDSEPSQEIVLVQTLLNELGYGTGTPDGVMGPKTRDAIRSFERSQGMPETGNWSSRLVARLQGAVAERTASLSQ